jgi:hypothetical protein
MKIYSKMSDRRNISPKEICEHIKMQWILLKGAQTKISPFFGVLIFIRLRDEGARKGLPKAGDSTLVKKRKRVSEMYSL